MGKNESIKLVESLTAHVMGKNSARKAPIA